MGKLVNVVTPSGRVVSVPEEEANGLQGASSSDVAETGREQLNEDRSSGFGEGAKAFGEGLADTATFGGYGKAAEMYSDQTGSDWAGNMEQRGQRRPGARFLGEAAGMLAPTGLVGDAAKGASELSAVGLTGHAAEAIGEATGSNAARVLSEGALYGVQGEIARSNVTGDPLTIEGALEGATIGAVLNVGADVGGSLLLNKSAKAKQSLVDIAQQRADEDLVRSRATLFDDSPAYNEVRDAHTAVQTSLRQQNREILDENRAYAESLDPDEVKKTIAGYRKAHHEVLSQINASPYGKQVGEAASAQRDAVAAYEQQSKKYSSFVNDTSKLPDTFQRFQKAIDDIGERYGVKDTDLTDQLQATSDALKAGVTPQEMEAGRAVEADYKSSVGETPIAEELRGYRERLSKAAKLHAGEYDAEASARWTPEDRAANVDAAMQELHSLRDDLSKYSFVKKPNLPDLPVKPPQWALPTPEGDIGNLRELSSAAVDLDRSIESARSMAKGKDYGAALAELRAVQGRIRGVDGMGDLVFPELPNPPRAPIPFDEVKLPKTLREFGRMKPETIEKWANGTAGEQTVNDSLNKLAAEIGVTPGTSAAETAAAMHKTIGDSMAAYERLQATAAKTGKSTGIMGLIREGAKNAAVNVAGMSAFGLVGGLPGAALGAFARTGARSAMDGIESSVLDGTLMAAKQQIRQKVKQVVAKLGVVGKGLKKLGPVTAYLAQSFPDGARDPETDPRKQAVNRITNILHTSIAAPDNSYLAVKPLLGHPSDVGGKIHDHVINAVSHLATTAPRDPGIDVTPFGSRWTPSFQQTVEFASRIEAVQNPLAAVERALRGDGNPAAADTLWQVWPAVMQELAAEYSNQAASMKLTYEKSSALSQLFRVPLSGLQNPVVVNTLQGLYLPQPTPQGKNSNANTGGAPGRPARVNSSVAGSSVSALTQ